MVNVENYAAAVCPQLPWRFSKDDRLLWTICLNGCAKKHSRLQVLAARWENWTPTGSFRAVLIKGIKDNNMNLVYHHHIIFKWLVLNLNSIDLSLDDSLPMFKSGPGHWAPQPAEIQTAMGSHLRTPLRQIWYLINSIKFILIFCDISTQIKDPVNLVYYIYTICITLSFVTHLCSIAETKIGNQNNNFDIQVYQLT